MPLVDHLELVLLMQQIILETVVAVELDLVVVMVDQELLS